MVFVTGDCHGNFRRFQSEYFPEQANMTKDDNGHHHRRLRGRLVWRQPRR